MTGNNSIVTEASHNNGLYNSRSTNRAFADRRGYDNEFITDNNLAYVKPTVNRDKQHYVCSENTLYETGVAQFPHVDCHSQ